MYDPDKHPDVEAFFQSVINSIVSNRRKAKANQPSDGAPEPDDLTGAIPDPEAVADRCERRVRGDRRMDAAARVLEDKQDALALAALRAIQGGGLEPQELADRYGKPKAEVYRAIGRAKLAMVTAHKAHPSSDAVRAAPVAQESAS